ncbi:MAG: hypothetical protein SGPRY_015065, partial [Prymnesium sp.]
MKSRLVQTQYAANMALRHQRTILQHARAEGQLPLDDASRLMDAINRKIKKIYIEPMRPWGEDSEREYVVGGGQPGVQAQTSGS